MEEGSDVRVRNASPEDYHHVLAINSDIYWGRDYLPWRYHAILASPLYKAVVCEQKDTIVSTGDGNTRLINSHRHRRLCL